MKTANWLIGMLAITAIAAGSYLYLQKEHEEDRVGRLLINIDPNSKFSATEVAEALQAKLVEIDPRNPYKAIHKIHLNTPLIVITPPLNEELLNDVAVRNGYRYINITNGSLDVAIAECKHLQAMTPCYSSEIRTISKDDATRLYQLMGKVDKIFRKHQIIYWATAGTLLGAVRHQGIIPWDDDLDICIMDIHEPKLKEIQHELEESGLVLTHCWQDFYKIYEMNGDQIPFANDPDLVHPYYFPYVDVFVLTLEKGREYQDIYVHKALNSNLDYGKERFSYNQIKNIHEVPFGPLMMPIPGNPEIFLTTIYSTPNHPDLWKKYAIEPVYIHKTERPNHIKGAAMVEIDDFSPAPYIKK